MSTTATTEEEKIAAEVTETTPAYKVDYEDERFKNVEADKQTAISDMEKTYSGMIDESQDYYDKQIQAAKDWEQKQTELQNQQTDFAIQEIEQQKEQAQKDYIKEQKGAYVDWQKQSNEYGANEEAEAMRGMSNTGYSESSQVSMYNTYQNRVTAARESYNLAVQNYNNSITEARLQNNSALAEIAFQSLQKQLELSLQGFQYKNQLLLDQANKKLELDSEYYSRYQDVLSQINTENALAEQIRQFNEEQALAREEFEYYKNRSSGGGGGSGGYSGGSYQSTKTSDSTGRLPSDTASSIIALGQGPISASNLASQVASGKVTQSQSTSTGNTIFSPSGLNKPSEGSSNKTSFGTYNKPSNSSSSKSSSSSSSSGGSWVSKVVNTVKSWFK